MRIEVLLPALPRFCPVCDAAAPSDKPVLLFGDSLLKTLVGMKATRALRTKAISNLINFKWYRFGRRSFILQLLVYVAFVLISSVVLLAGSPQEPRCADWPYGAVRDVSGYSARDWIGSRFAYLLVAAGSVYHLVLTVTTKLRTKYDQEAHHQSQKPSAAATSGALSKMEAMTHATLVYLLDVFNMSDLVCYGLGIAVTIARWWCEAGDKLTSQLSAVFLVLLWVKILPFFQGFYAGRFARMFYNILENIIMVCPPR